MPSKKTSLHATGRTCSDTSNMMTLERSEFGEEIPMLNAEDKSTTVTGMSLATGREPSAQRPRLHATRPRTRLLLRMEAGPEALLTFGAAS